MLLPFREAVTDLRSIVHLIREPLRTPRAVRPICGEFSVSARHALTVLLRATEDKYGDNELRSFRAVMLNGSCEQPLHSRKRRQTRTKQHQFANAKL